MEKVDKRLELQSLILEIERNRIHMRIAWLKAEVLDGAVQSAEERVDNVRSAYAARKKKSGCNTVSQG
jgi:hypothetical protein